MSVSTVSHACHAKATLPHACHAKEAETQGRQRNPRAYIRHLGSAHCPTPATQKKQRPRDARGTPGRTWQCTLSYACHAKEAETQGRQRNARAYIRPLDSAHCPTPATQKRRRPRDASGTPGTPAEPQGVFIRPLGTWRAGGGYKIVIST